ncbi:MAG: hypothetical protein ACXVXJ_07020, partial [Mycobacteriaceae bacterium]
ESYNSGAGDEEAAARLSGTLSRVAMETESAGLHAMSIVIAGGAGHRLCPAAGPQLARALLRRQTTPDPIRFVDLQSMPTARLDDGTRLTHRLGPRIPPQSRRTTLALRVKEHRCLQSATRGLRLPLPVVFHRTGKATVIRHSVSPPSIELRDGVNPLVWSIGYVVRR